MNWEKLCIISVGEHQSKTSFPKILPGLKIFQNNICELNFLLVPLGTRTVGTTYIITQAYMNWEKLCIVSVRDHFLNYYLD